MYKKVATDLNFEKREREILDFWAEHDIKGKSLNHRKGREIYTFYDGPPTANGQPHIGHVITRAVKDLIPRYRSMKGYDVARKAGWDTHGLPVELEVEKRLGINGKPQIEAYGVAPFIEKCKESVWTYKSQWEDMSARVAFWADMDKPYVTYTNDYIESVWWSLKQIWEKGLIYKGHKVVPFCPRCGTALSSHEVAQGYKDITEPSIYVKFKLAGKQNEFFLAWTTTPWTLPSNTTLVVHPEHEYAKVEWRGAYYILAKALVESVFKVVDAETPRVVCTYKGAELCGMAYEPLFDFVKPDKKAWYVCADAYVTLSEGTGIVHAAPAFGEDDARIGHENELPFIQLVDTQGRFTPEAYLWAGMFVKDADPKITSELERLGLLFGSAENTHSYPFCWRCDTPLLYYARDTWFIQMTALRDNLVRNNNKINWLPDNVKHGRFGNFVENVVDWSLSRERYWGTPLPIWICDDSGCGCRHAVGSRAELYEMGVGVPEDLEFHKPFIDAVKLVCPRCGGQMTRTPEVIDCWYDAGSMPFAQWHYPFENADQFSAHFPADFISEAVDQTRGWFYTLLAISTLLFDDTSYNNCIVLGHVQDKDGRKMSKHLYNVIDPWDALNLHGADAVRWYFFTASAPWLPSRFSLDAVGEVQRKYMGTLWNTYAFYILYAGIDGFDPTAHSLVPGDLDVMDRWILSRLNSLIKYVDGRLGEYLITEPARAIASFVDELSNWYVRRCRERYWQSGMLTDKISAFMTLYKVLYDIARLSAPFTPFISEAIYQNLVRSVDRDAPLSVHLTDFPAPDERFIDLELEANMQFVSGVVALGRACRNAANIKNRQPLSTVYVASSGGLDKKYHSIVLEELNIKALEFTDASQGFVSYRFKPQLRTLGPRYGKLLPKIGAYLSSADGDALKRELDAAGKLCFTIDGAAIELLPDDLLTDAVRRDDFVSESDGGVTVAINTRISDELLEEGYTRELISKIQNMRKEAGYEVTDHIRLAVGDGGLFSGVFERNYAVIARETLADGAIAIGGGGAAGPDGAFSKEWALGDSAVAITIIKA